MKPTLRTALNRELRRRRSANPRYSLRAFARDLEVHHATLSLILRGRRTPSPATAARLARHVGLEPDSLDAVRDAFERIAADPAAPLLDWRHFAILQLVHHPDFQPDSRWIAAAFGSTVDFVNLAIQRLLRMGLLTMDRHDRWSDHSGGAAALARRTAELQLHDSQSKIMGQPVTHFQILSRDPDQAAAFYSKLFGWTVDTANALGYRRLATHPNKGIDGGIWPLPPEGHPFVQLFVDVPDLEASVTMAVELGARVVVPPTSLPEREKMAVIVDPQGLSFALIER